MNERIKVSEFAQALLELSKPIDPFDMPLLDAHGATLARDVYAGERLVLREGSRIRSTQIGLAASIGLDHLPTRPQPRVVVISAGNDLVEPGQKLIDANDEFETNSWLLTTAVKEAGAVGYRVHMIPETDAALKDIIEDQLVRADLIVISGEREDESFDLITRVLQQLGTVTAVTPNIEGSGNHNYGTIGPDKTPVVVLPGDPISNFLSAELFIRPMITKMLTGVSTDKPNKKVKLTKSVTSPSGVASYIRGELNAEGQVSPLADQQSLMTLSKANCLITLGEKEEKLNSGDSVNILKLNQDRR